MYLRELVLLLMTGIMMAVPPDPPSSTHYPRNSEFNSRSENYNPNSATSIMKWKFTFSGLEVREDPKAIDVDTFLHKVRDHCQSENITRAQILNKIQLLLRGPSAADWYLYARKNIDSWEVFKQKIRMRFSWAVDLEDLRYRISTKRQKPGEFTLRFYINLW